MASVWGELKRRKVVKVAVAYAIVGWLLIEVSTTVLPLFEAPDWITQVFAFFVILGFPVALILSWAYELTPGGIKLERDVASSESITHVTGRKLDFAIIGALVLALGFVVYNYALEDSEVAVSVLPNSVAVLPFEDMSANPEYAYFAPGMHDEILNQLAKLQNLNVIARTSVMQYAGAARPITEIARELNVGTIMEGSVSYAEGRVAIRVQLIDAETGVHLWSDSYNREFSDVFEIQADIAMNVANALEAEFSLDEQASIEVRPTDSPDAYALYLRALDATSIDEALRFLGTAIEIDPNFALAYATRAAWMIVYGRLPDPDDVYRAIELDPTLGLAHVTLAVLHEADGRLAEAEQSYENAYRLSPNDPFALMARGRFLRNGGRYADAIELFERATKIDPYVMNNYHQLGISYRYNEEYEKAAESARRAIEIEPSNSAPHTALAYVEIIRGNFDIAERELRLAEQLGALEAVFRVAQFAYAYAQMDRHEAVQRLYNEFQERAAEEGANDGEWTLVYLAIGDDDNAAERLEAAVGNQTINSIALGQIRANDYGNAVLEEPRFRMLRDQIGSI